MVAIHFWTSVPNERNVKEMTNMNVNIPKNELKFEYFIKKTFQNKPFTNNIKTLNEIIAEILMETQRKFTY